MSQLKENIESAYIELPDVLMAEIEDVFTKHPDAAI